MPTTLIVTNDFPPRVGGIESFVADVVELLDADVVVLTSRTPGSAVFDQMLDFEVVRMGRVLLPTRATTRTAARLLSRTGASRVLFGAAAPLALMTPALRRAGAQRVVAMSHGHETWWAALPGARSLLRRLADDADHLSTISDFTADRIGPRLSTAAQHRMIRLPPPVSTAVFRPGGRSFVGPDRPRCIAVGRLVRQKGFDTLLRAWRLVLDGWSGGGAVPELVVVGEGPQRSRLAALLVALDLAGTVRMIGKVSRGEVVGQLQQADVFALPMRTRLGGLNPEGLGLAALEAAACGLPVIVGDSGGAPETVLHGRSGFVVKPHDHHQLAGRILALFNDPSLARSMGAAGRNFVESRFSAVQTRATLRSALGLDGPSRV
jgi:phosphatidylinositol alpha-1,6-mannosyltransferase